MNRFRIGAAIFLSLLMVIWSIPLMAGDHAVNIQWVGPTNEVLNDDCAQVGEVLANPINYTVQIRKTGVTTWSTVETTDTSLEIGGLDAVTVYEVRIGAHYTGGTVLCWTDVESVTTPADQPPAGCSSLSVTSIR